MLTHRAAGQRVDQRQVRRDVRRAPATCGSSITIATIACRRGEIAARLPLIDYRRSSIDAAREDGVRHGPGIRVHVGGIGKGYAVDRSVAILRERGFHDFMVQAGGDLYVAGSRGEGLAPGDQRSARPPNDSFADDRAARRDVQYVRGLRASFIQNGRRYHHILDPPRANPRAAPSASRLSPDAR